MSERPSPERGYPPPNGGTRTRRLANNPDYKHHKAASFLERRFSGYVETEQNGGPLAARYAYNRTIFGGQFPALAAYEISGASYPGRTQRSHLPNTMPFAASIYAVALKGEFNPAFGFVSDEDEKDGMGEAMDTARGIYELFYDALMEDLGTPGGLRGLVQDAQVTNIETGTTDSLGNPLMDETGRRLLVVYRPTISVTF